MTDKKPISLEQKLYAAFVDGIKSSRRTRLKDFSFIEQQELADFMEEKHKKGEDNDDR